MTQPPSDEQIDSLIRTALEEDLGPGDITTRSILADNRVKQAEVLAKEAMVLCGVGIFRRVFSILDPAAEFPEAIGCDGDEIAAGERILTVRAGCIALLEGERTALNILQRLSGISTLTRKFVQQAKPVVVLDTRKTTPGLRVFEKYAVKCGGGMNHRFGLFDAVLIKDNHIKAAGGITEAVARVRNKLGSEKTVEVETTNIEEVAEALAAGVDIIMLDNMPTELIRQAVKLVCGKVKIEISGSISLERLEELARSGADYVSVGALTHSAPAVDISMDILD